MAKARILIADDEVDLVWAIRYSLEDEGYEVLTAYDGAQTLAVARRHRPDLIILDILMPHVDGLEICQTLRRDPSLAAVPILFLTARSTVEDIVTGLDIGGDDYLTKPFDLKELKARVRALLRRRRPVSTVESASPYAQVLTVGPVRLDLRSRQVHVGEKTTWLTPTEFDLLHHLMSHPDEVFSSRRLLEEVWGFPPDVKDTSVVRWHIRNLRAKIEPDPNRPIYICTVTRHGYVFRSPDHPSRSSRNPNATLSHD